MEPTNHRFNSNGTQTIVIIYDSGSSWKLLFPLPLPLSIIIAQRPSLITEDRCIMASCIESIHLSLSKKFSMNSIDYTGGVRQKTHFRFYLEKLCNTFSLHNNQRACWHLSMKLPIKQGQCVPTSNIT